MEKDLTATERRTEQRTEIGLAVQIDLAGARLQGQTRNLSRGGLLAVTSDQLRVRVRFGGEERDGSVVRVQALDERTLSLAVRFDEHLPESSGP